MSSPTGALILNSKPLPGMFRSGWLWAVLVVILCFNKIQLKAQPVHVQLVQESGVWRMERAGSPYYVRGAGGQVHLPLMVECGANSLRTWGIERAQQILDSAHRLGLTVMLGMWMGHERHGFDYDDPVAVREQFLHFASVIDRFKTHPALLCWGIGNEVDLFYTNVKVWDAIQEVAAYAHAHDPHHPTSTVTAGLDSMEVHWIKTKAPDIDILGVNTYGDLEQALTRIRPFGWDKAYMITEWGPNGHWEVAKMPWGAPVEQSSEAKFRSYRRRYSKIKAKESEGCVGSYAFLWGQKQETTESWYGLLDTEGRPTRAVDALMEGWKESPVAQPAPVIESIATPSTLHPDSPWVVHAGEWVEARLPDSVGMATLRWKVLPEATHTKAGGDFEQSLGAVRVPMRTGPGMVCRFKAPAQEGAYRLYVSAVNRAHKSAHANRCFYVKPARPRSDWGWRWNFFARP